MRILCMLFAVMLAANVSAQDKTSGKTNFNPDVSLILDGRYASYEDGSEEHAGELEGFELAGEAAERPEEGFSLGHAELVISADVDDKFYGQMNIAIAEYDGDTEVELEEAFVETTALNNGFKVKGGRFLSGIGYHNQQHAHAWDFIDAPLVYKGMWGQAYKDDGVRVSWVAPTDTFVEVGAEAFAGEFFPAGNDEKKLGATTFFANVGGDFNESSSWQVGVSHHRSNLKNRVVEAHSHGHGDEHDHDDHEDEHEDEEHHDDEEHADEDDHDHEGEEHHAEEDHEESLTGKSHTTGISAVYKWAPNGNYKNKHFKLQGEYFIRNEEGEIAEEDEVEKVDYDQSGFYVQGVYQFRPQWRTGLRYDSVKSDLDEENVDPKRYSATLEYVPSEFSRLRLQYSRDESTEEAENQVFLQYTMSLGSHGAHSF